MVWISASELDLKCRRLWDPLCHEPHGARNASYVQPDANKFIRSLANPYFMRVRSSYYREPIHLCSHGENLCVYSRRCWSEGVIYVYKGKKVLCKLSSIFWNMDLICRHTPPFLLTQQLCQSYSCRNVGPYVGPVLHPNLLTQ